MIRSLKRVEAAKRVLRERLPKATAVLNERGREKKRPRDVEEARQAAEAVLKRCRVEEAVRRLDWRVYATNRPAEDLPLTQAAQAYRGKYIIEQAFGRLKGQPLSLTPMYYLQRDDRATELIRLLSIGLRALTLLEFAVRRRLATEGAEFARLYTGNPKQTTSQPTAEQLLEAFQEITLTVIQEGDQTRRHLTPLSTLQESILRLLDFPPEIYT